MSNDQDSQGKGWWQTLPGMLTAGAGIITAITGLLLALNQTGMFHRSPAAQTEQTSSPAQQASSPAASTAAIAPANSRPLLLPQMTQVHSDENVYQLLSARIDPYSPDKVTLHLTVRMANNGKYPTNFWVSSFRLLVDGSLQAPTNDLNELVASNSSETGSVDFVIPATTSTAGLQMGDVGEGKPTINLQLSAR